MTAIRKRRRPDTPGERFIAGQRNDPGNQGIHAIRPGQQCVSAILQDLFSGGQPYRGLKQRLIENFGGSLCDIAMSLGFGRPAPHRMTAKP